MAVDDKYTVSLLHFDGGITDESGKVWTAVSSATTSTTQSEFGGSSLSLNGKNQAIAIPWTEDFAFGTGDFTIDCWVYLTAFPANYGTITDNDTSAATSFQLSVSKTGVVQFWVGATGYSATTALTTGSWYHIAAVRFFGTLLVFINGTQVYSGSVPTNIVQGTPNVAIGCEQSGGPAYFFPGYIDEFRVSKGIARWTSDFTPPTAPYSPGTSVNAPTDLTAAAGDSQVTLAWTAVPGATGYNVRRATTASGPYTAIASNVSTNSYVDTTVTNGITYYYVVKAVNAYGESAISNEASATPVASSKALLRVTMSDSSEREYKLTTTEINDFVKWINQSTNTGNHCYTFNDTIEGSTEYLLFEKIISFKVIPLAK